MAHGGRHLREFPLAAPQRELEKISASVFNVYSSLLALMVLAERVGRLGFLNFRRASAAQIP